MLSKLLLTAVNIQLITDGSQIHYFHLRAIEEYVPKIRWKNILCPSKVCFNITEL
ncbi:Hypothetical protein J6898_00646 [Nakaseomyces glabratus]|nr:hypothetical protein J6894_00649 [Nakaseomyces glabratus]